MTEAICVFAGRICQVIYTMWHKLALDRRELLSNVCLKMASPVYVDGLFDVSPVPVLLKV